MKFFSFNIAEVSLICSKILFSCHSLSNSEFEINFDILGGKGFDSLDILEIFLSDSTNIKESDSNSSDNQIMTTHKIKKDYESVK